jgi:hypothetical protein
MQTVKGTVHIVPVNKLRKILGEMKATASAHSKVLQTNSLVMHDATT